MAELQRHFLQGIMNKDLDPHFLPDGQYRDALNIIVADSDGTFSTVDGQHNGVAQNYLGNIQMSDSLGLSPNALCIGALSNPAQNTIYWMIASDEFDAVVEYNEEFDVTSFILKATKNSATTPSILNFNKQYRITGINYINGLLFWTDNYNPPRKINIERCRNYAVDGFTEDDISVIVKPPIASPVISFPDVEDTLPNNLENKFLYFSYRYKYLDDEYSSLSPFSPVAFFPKPFAYDYGVSENISMVNSKSAVDIEYNTGGPNVKEIQLVFIDTLSTNAYVIDNINKQENNFANNATETFTFQNNKVYTVLPADQINRLFDNVPLRAQAQDLIGSRLIYGNYTQFFDLVDYNGANIKPAFSVYVTGNDIIGDGPQPTFKSNRDYEVGIVYLDDYGRSTTVIVPAENTNTVYIPPSYARKYTSINILIDKDYAPPAFATYYRFVLKQNKQEYYNVFPLTYFSDGQFKWFLINQVDVDKISVGGYVYLKNSTNGNLNTQFKVLDIVSKSANFLNNGKYQPAGVYFKVKIESTLLPDLYQYNFTNTGIGNGNELLSERFNVAEKAIFYGTQNTHTMVTSNANGYSGINDIRFKVVISDTNGTNKFKYYAFLLGTPYTYVEELTITAGVDQTLSYTYNSVTYSCVVRFSSATGYNLNDYWTINCRSTNGKNIFGGNLNGVDSPFAWVTGTKWNLNNTWAGDRPIEAGATISIKSKEPNNGNNDVLNTFTSSKRYVNIEEWFIEDNAYANWIQYEGPLAIGPKNVCFRRVNDFAYNPTFMFYDADQGGSISEATLNQPVYMWVFGYDTGSNPPQMQITFDFQDSDAPILFETVPTDNNQDIYYELTNTFPIINNSHQTNNTNQVLGEDDGIAILGFNGITDAYPNYDFNAFAWDNGVESFRIRDDWNAATMQFSPRANSTVEGYAQQTLVQALTYSGVYQQTTAINRLNEFNLSLGNFKYLDRFFGSIQKLHARDTDLVVLQENKTSKVLYGKNLISDSIGGGTIASIPEVLGTQIAYVGEYGISDNPESFATWGNNMYFTDARRGAVMQLSEAGLFEISSNGMKNWFKANLNQPTVKIGMIDPYFEHYVLSINNDRPISTCQLSVSSDNVVVSGIANINQFAFAVESNSQWSIVVPANDWLIVNTKYGNGNGQVLVTTTSTTTPRSLVVTVVGCNTEIDVEINQAAQVTGGYWYQLYNCSNATTKYSVEYSTRELNVDDRVISDGIYYRVLGWERSDPGTTQISITDTGETGCPSTPPTQEWYNLVNCLTSATAVSTNYTVGTFAVFARVTSGSNTYRVASTTNINPGGTQISILPTGLTGCPPAPTQEWYKLYNCATGATAYSIAYSIGHLSVSDRVTSLGSTYTVTEVLYSAPIGSLLTLTDTGEVGCPIPIIYYTLT